MGEPRELKVRVWEEGLEVSKGRHRLPQWEPPWLSPLPEPAKALCDVPVREASPPQTSVAPLWQ